MNKLSKKPFLRHILEALTAIAVGIFFTFIFGGIRLMDNSRYVLLYSLYGVIVGVFLWKGNAFVSNYLAQRVQWDKNPKKAFGVQLAGSFAYTIGFIVIFNSIWFPWFKEMSLYDFWIGRSIGRNILFLQFFVTIMISAILYTKEFFISWQNSIKNEEELRRKAISLQYESLKNQLNPHFLFNSLNVLSSLVYKDPDQSNEFIKKLSDVYRYVLDQKQKELVSLEEEMNFLADFVYLHQIRFGENLQVKVQAETKESFSLVPMSLQILIENAIKHNIITNAKSLLVEVILHENTLEVRNALQLKSSVGFSSKIGLENLNSQYQYLMEKEIKITKTDESFSVKLPLLKA